MPIEISTEFAEDEIPTQPDYKAPETLCVDHEQDIDLGPQTHADGNVGSVNYGNQALANHNSPIVFRRSMIVEYCNIAIKSLDKLNALGQFNIRNGHSGGPIYLAIHDRLTQISKANQDYIS